MFYQSAKEVVSNSLLRLGFCGCMHWCLYCWVWYLPLLRSSLGDGQRGNRVRGNILRMLSLSPQPLHC